MICAFFGELIAATLRDVPGPTLAVDDGFRGVPICSANVSNGSTAGPRASDLVAENQPFASDRRTAAVRVRPSSAQLLTVGLARRPAASRCEASFGGTQAAEGNPEPSPRSYGSGRPHQLGFGTIALGPA